VLNHQQINKEAKFNQIAIDSFAMISDWYHYAILELTHLKSFKSDSRWIARKLNISMSESNLAIERLKRLGFLRLDISGKLINASGSNTNISGEMRDSAKRKLQRHVLEMAIQALEECPIERRNQTSMTMAIHSKRLPEAIEKITNFRREMSAILEQDLERDQVYQLGISFYPLTQAENRNEEK
jgi:uncharacterized protein (TIGR02147 family)